MVKKHIVEAGLVAVGAALAAAAARALLRRNDSIALQRELLDLVQLGQDSRVTVQDIQINDRIGFVLIALGCLHLKRDQYSEFASHFPGAALSHAILLSGPEGTEAYHQLIAKALAHYFKAKLLILDVTDLVSKAELAALKRNTRPFACSIARNINNKSVAVGLPVAPSNDSNTATQVSLSTSLSTGIRSDDKVCSSWDASAEMINKSPAGRPGSPGAKRLLVGQRQTVAFKEDIFVDVLFKVLATLSETSPVVVYFPDVENFFPGGTKMYSFFLTKMEKLSGPIIILGSRTKPMDDRLAIKKRIDKSGVLFRYKFHVQPPEDHPGLDVEKAVKIIQAQDNRMRIMDVLYDNNFGCDDISSLDFNDGLVLSDRIDQELVFSALCHHLMNMKLPEYREGMLLISAKSLTHALKSLETGKMQSNKVQDEKKAIEPDNRFEKDIRLELIPAGEIGVKFQDIGVLENVKEVLQELVMLPLRRPEFFNIGGLIKPCKGILLFGPPGTGKTMLAKAVATEAGASFINVSMSAIASTWYGEEEKYVRALFTLAGKVAPTVIFIDEVDSMLGKPPTSGDNEAIRIIKFEFMARWDCLLSEGGKHVLVLAATNRPYDLDEAVIHRFERRIMVNLPDPENRGKILRTILSKEELAEDFDFKEVATMTESYSGRDLKNLCIAAAYRRLREHLSNEQKEEKKVAALKIGESSKVLSITTGESEVENDEFGKPDETTERKMYDTDSPSRSPITLRPLSMQDIKEAKKLVSASFAINGVGMQVLLHWNDIYGVGGSGAGSDWQKQLTYFL